MDIEGPYTIKESGDKWGGFMGYIVVGPGLPPARGNDAEHGIAKKDAERMNIAYAEGQRSAAGGPELRKQRDELLAFVVDLQWDWCHPREKKDCCPVCHGLKSQGHAPDCRLAAAIGGG